MFYISFVLCKLLQILCPRFVKVYIGKHVISYRNLFACDIHKTNLHYEGDCLFSFV